ncbi:hypothetical protein HDU96_002337 [Phlyctochytrium bullatum]|nr:hypothetical protein HDU96_002337 [Phlyctochytrium bullatum]
MSAHTNPSSDRPPIDRPTPPMITSATTKAILLLGVAVSAVNAQAGQDLGVAWGFGGSAFQLEGAWDRDGKGLGTYDSIDRMESDLRYLSQVKATAYRFSISWPRILPNCTGAVNPLGIAFYRRMIDNIIANGAEPYLTMFHWDLPQACQDQFGGFADPRIMDAFLEYARVLLENFSDRVQYWLTINEPEANCKFGWEQGIFAPGLRLGTQVGRFNCLKYSHLIHARIVRYARETYASRNLKFGVPSIVSWYQAGGSQTPADLAAADFVQQRDLGWFFDPCVFGDWGDAAKNDPYEGQYVRNAGAAFTAEEQALLRNTTDFIALNYYSTSGIVADASTTNGHQGASPPNSYQSGSSWQNVYAPGLRMLINYVARRYPGIDIHLTEIGFTAINEDQMTLDQIVYNPDRLKFWTDHLKEFSDAITIDRAPLRSFLAWAIMDNFEWIQYRSKFGQIHVDFSSPNLTRTIKNSTWYISDFFSGSRSPFPARQAVLSTTTAAATTTTSAAATSAASSASGTVRTTAATSSSFTSTPSVAPAPATTKSGVAGGAWGWTAVVAGLVGGAVGVLGL